jgi:hypothetical protein
VSDEPQIHSFEADCLPEEHPLAHETVFCAKCSNMVHAFNNECMTPWVEWRGKVLCLECAKPALVDWQAFKQLVGAA